MTSKPYQNQKKLEKWHWEDGMSAREIAEEFDVDPSTITYHMEKHDIPRRDDMKKGFWESLEETDPIFDYVRYLAPKQRADLIAVVRGESVSERARKRNVEPATIRKNIHSAYERLNDIQSEGDDS